MLAYGIALRSASRLWLRHVPQSLRGLLPPMITTTHYGEQSAQTQGYSKHLRRCHLLYTTVSIVIASLRFLYFYRYRRSGFIPPDILSAFRGIECISSAWKIFNVTFSGILYQIIRGGVERITRVYAGLCALPKANTDIERVPWMRK